MSDPTYRDMGLSEEEYQSIIKIMGREPNLVETGVFSVMWSEHCGYKSSRPVLKGFPTSGPQVIQGPGENAGVVDIGDNQALVFKMESHNHPSAIEPYQGAATGVGGIVRDIFTMGARPIALLNSLRFGPLDEETTRHLFSGVVAGIAGYGNCLGIPTVAGDVYFHPSYRDNCLVNAMCVGLVNQNEIAYAVASEVGASIMLVGAKTGRDGIHGATFASEELSDSSVSKRSSVQVGDPFMEKLLIEACLELIKEDLVAGMQDLGAAGLTSSAAECASKTPGRGVEIDVALVPRRETGMTPYEVMLSESQERMLIIPRAGTEDRIQKIFTRWGLDASYIGKVTGDGRFRVLENGVTVGDVPIQALTEECPVYHRPTTEPGYYLEKQSQDLSSLPEPDDYNQVLMKLLSQPSIASKEWVYQQYDHQVMTNTVVCPGKADAAVLRIKGTPKGVALTSDCNSRFVYLDPYRGGQMVVAEAARNLACTGAKPLALTDCLNFGNPEKPEIFWQFSEACRGMGKAAQILDTPVVSGNVSLYNESQELAVYPTPVVGMVGLIPDVEKRMDMAFKTAGDVIILLGRLNDGIGGSEYLSLIHGYESGRLPDIDLEEEAKLLHLLQDLISQGMVKSAHDISDGGLAACLAEAAIAGNIGGSIELALGGRSDYFLFSEAPSRAVVTCNPEKQEAVVSQALQAGLPALVIGRVGEELLTIKVNGRELIKQGVTELSHSWKEAIPCAMG
ncbi:MAG: phosphoribosylformylglycinamidine synthase subunit PurL [Methylocystaceae bacterium]